MKRLLIALAGYALYRWWTSPATDPAEAAPRTAAQPRRRSADTRPG